MVHLLFRTPAAVAIVGGHVSKGGTSDVAENLAAELGASGKRVVVVDVSTLLSNPSIPVPDDASFVLGSSTQVWLWPRSSEQRIEIYKPREASGPRHWLDALRDRFDAIVLDCPNIETVAGVSEVASMADTTVLAIEAGVRSKRQIEQDQSALQLRGATVVGCILIQRG